MTPSSAPFRVSWLSQLPTPEQLQAEAERRHSEEDPAFFARKILGVEPWDKQERILEAVTRHPRVAVRSGHKVGKSTSAAILALWWVFAPKRRPGARVILTAPTGRQVRSILWREVRRLFFRAQERGYFPDAEIHRDPGTGLQFDDGREIVGFSTDEPERMAGFSGKHLLFLVDEASGVLQEIFEAVEGNRAGGARLVLFGNPTQTSGEFYDAFTSKAEFYDTHAIASTDTPNVREGREVVPGLATREWVTEKEAEWGPGDPRYEVRVAGNFPGEGEAQVVGLRLVEAAMGRTAPPSGPLTFGLDPAREGDDDSVLCGVRGSHCYPLVVLPKGDGPSVAAFALAQIKSLRVGEERVRVKVDSIGLGSSPLDALRHSGEKWLEVVAVNSAAASPDRDYANLRAQMGFGVAEWLKGGGTLPKDAKLKAELVAAKYAFDTQNRLKIEPKSEIKKRLGRSPDRADALALALYRAPDLSAMIRVLQQTRRPPKPPRATW